MLIDYFVRAVEVCSRQGTISVVAVDDAHAGLISIILPLGRLLPVSTA